MKNRYWVLIKFLFIMHFVSFSTCLFELVFISDWFKAVRATSILGFISLLVGIVMILLKMFVVKDMKPVLFAAIGAAFVGGKKI